jgi:2-C-methyl-D-erythritol 4-phosphate cytidylyltransferase/2-C-methyl-D-erythritol 2,4-cyclodiphosphate synthase
MSNATAAIIAAAGFGTRMKHEEPKQYLCICGVPILVRTVRAFIDHQDVEQVIVVVPADRVQATEDLLEQHQAKPAGLDVVAGGKRRQDSVQAGLSALSPEIEIVLVHDGARPLISSELIDRCRQAAIDSGAAIAAIPVKDTLKRGDASGRIQATVDRTSLFQAQTPQAMQRQLLIQAYQTCGGEDVTDEASLLEKCNIPVQLVAGAETNIKITHPEDLALAEKIIRESSWPTLRIGHGYDAHRFTEGRKLVLGGIEIPHPQGLAGHSDADVLTHALCDAILGGLGAGDIGRHFPDSDNSFKDIYSIRLLDRVVTLASEKGYRLTNADITVICQQPRLAPHLEAMRELLAKTCLADPQVVNIKATTTEQMGFTGRGEGIGCHAVVLLQAVSQ